MSKLDTSPSPFVSAANALVWRTFPSALGAARYEDANVAGINAKALAHCETQTVSYWGGRSASARWMHAVSAR